MPRASRAEAQLYFSSSEQINSRLLPAKILTDMVPFIRESRCSVTRFSFPFSENAMRGLPLWLAHD